MKAEKRKLRWQQFLPLEILVGLLLLSAAFLISSNADMAAAEKQLSDSVEYIKEQCNSGQLRDLASEAKSLLRVTESVEQARLRLTYEAESQRPEPPVLETIAKDVYLSGLILLDADGNILAQCGTAGIAAEALLAQVDKKALLDAAAFREKDYAVRLTNEDMSHIDLAAVGSADDAGVIVGYYYTSAAYADTFNNSVRALVTGYTPEHDGIIAVSSGNRIVASNSEALVGTDIDDTPILRRIMERGSGKKLIHASSGGSVLRHDFGLMDKGQNYYIYAYMTERTVFSTTPQNLLYTLFLYLLLLVAVHMIWWQTERSYQRKQIEDQKKYTDLLESKNAQLHEAVQQAEKANAAKSNFLSRMSHDIRTPLNGIVGLLKIDEAHFDDRQLVLANHEKMKTAADHLLSLINDVLEMSKLEDGNTVLTRERICLAELTKDIVMIVLDRAVEMGIEWNYEKGKTEIPYPYIYGSPVHLRQIFLNIYGNCIKYNRPGGKITTLVESLGEKDGVCTYRWTISDTGIGMSEEFLRHIFDPFTQERSDARSIYQGTGLGMTIVKSLIDQMGGTIHIESREGVGSTFFITLPFEIAPPPEERQPSAEAAAESSIRGLRLLLAEDNELNAEIAQTLLEDEGAEVAVVSNGEHAVELFRCAKPGTFDAILMDVMMPVMDGLAATRAIRALDRPDAKTIPILAMTANAFREDAQKCLDAGMNVHLAKPLQIREAVAAIARCCRGEQ